MDAREYLRSIVAPTIQDYAANATSVRHAVLACLATFHTVDYLAAPKSPGNLRKQLRDACPSFVLIDEIAHALKHVASSKSGLTVDGIITRPPAMWDTAVFDLSRWDDEIGGVTLEEDRDIDLLFELRTTLEFLEAKLPAIDEKWVCYIQTWAATEESIHAIYLFGSRVKANHTVNSDLDIAVLPVGDSSGERNSHYIHNAPRWREALSHAIPIAIHLQVVDPVEDKIVWPAVHEHGRKIFPIP